VLEVDLVSSSVDLVVTSIRMPYSMRKESSIEVFVCEANFCMARWHGIVVEVDVFGVSAGHKSRDASWYLDLE
jgi:hypothetical protein